METILHRIGRYLFALPFGVFGIMHFVAANQMAAIVPAYLPGGVFWVYLTGAALLAACTSIMAQVRTKQACILLAVMLAMFALMVHLPALLGGDQMAMGSLLKDLSLAGGALVMGNRYKL